jgi:hypothetical protein
MAKRTEEDRPTDITPEASRLLDEAIELTNLQLGGRPLPEHFNTDQQMPSAEELLDRVRAMARLRRYLDSMIDTDARSAIAQKVSYAVLAQVIRMSKARAHQLWPRKSPTDPPPDGSN